MECNIPDIGLSLTGESERVNTVTAQGEDNDTCFGYGTLLRRSPIKERSLIPVLPDESTLSRSYWMIWHESLKNSRQVQVVVKSLTQAVKESTGQFLCSNPDTSDRAANQQCCAGYKHHEDDQPLKMIGTKALETGQSDLSGYQRHRQGHRNQF